MKSAKKETEGGDEGGIPMPDSSCRLRMPGEPEQINYLKWNISQSWQQALILFVAIIATPISPLFEFWLSASAIGWSRRELKWEPFTGDRFLIDSLKEKDLVRFVDSLEERSFVSLAVFGTSWFPSPPLHDVHLAWKSYFIDPRSQPRGGEKTK